MRNDTQQLKSDQVKGWTLSLTMNYSQRKTPSSPMPTRALETLPPWNKSPLAQSPSVLRVTPLLRGGQGKTAMLKKVF